MKAQNKAEKALGQALFLHRLPVVKDKKKDAYHIIINTPQGSRNKYKYDLARIPGGGS